jgi:hypothetical protein
MRLLTDELRARLPRLHAQEAESDPVVYAKLFLHGTKLALYVLEDEATEHAGYVVACLSVGDGDFSYCHFPEWVLELLRGPNGEVVERDVSFQEGRLTDVVPAPDS